ncbi:hypothetical protein FR943_01695 [Mycobacterium sp. TNTM28]|uniref:Mce-associated membrane protein n=1 Tax=[Mycobacterium] fortunisiensis TaxID=2600579 RepID=A0ABS6KGA4_9MYCO|nr:hypothetical protein [[Mycobacterium] fortunisiensis]MBU9762566.1 hypothetical protein [[Mycobacterium] fortunisiensis]
MVEQDTEEAATPEGDDEAAEAAPVTAGKPPAAAPRQISVSLRTLVVSALIAVLAVAVGVLSWLYLDARSELGEQARRTADNQRAEQVALDYAVNAAQMDYRDLNAWKARLVAGTSPELKAKLGGAADSMEQILGPLQWQSTAKPLTAVVRSSTGGVYVVDSFVSVLTKTTQAPDGLQSTATYSVTIDSNADWLITDVGGIDAVVGAR